ncbi:MAG: nitroreductase family protein [Stellaceae bacterium]
MTANYDTELAARFGEDEKTPGGDLPELPLVRRMLLRRTQRRYADRPVPEPLLRLLLASAFSASSKSDFQQASVIGVADPERRARLQALVPAMPWIGAAPVFLVFCGDARRLERLGTLRGYPADNGRLESFFNAAIDAALVMQSFILAAEEAQLGCVPISVLRNHPDEIAAILELPDKVFPVAGLALGYPAAAGYISMRLPLPVTVHADRYDDTNLAEAAADYDRRRAARHQLPRERQRAPETFGYAQFYGWSEDKTRQQAAEPEGQRFPSYLRSRGFTLD